MKFWRWICPLCGGCSRKCVNHSSASKYGFHHLVVVHGAVGVAPVLERVRVV